MTGINGQNTILRLAALAAAIVAALLAAQPAHAVTSEYNLAIPGAGGSSSAPPLTQGTTPSAPTAPAPTTSAAPAPTTSDATAEPSKDKKKAKKKKPKRKLPELGPAKPPTIAAPVSAVARGTTPGIVPLAAVLALLALAALGGRRLIRRQAG